MTPRSRSTTEYRPPEIGFQAEASRLQKYLTAKARPRRCTDLESSHAWLDLPDDHDGWRARLIKEAVEQDRELFEIVDANPLATEHARRQLAEGVIAALARDPSCSPPTLLEWTLLRRVVSSRVVIDLLETEVKDHKGASRGDFCRELQEEIRRRLDSDERVLAAFHAFHPSGGAAAERWAQQLRKWEANRTASGDSTSAGAETAAEPSAQPPGDQPSSSETTL